MLCCAVLQVNEQFTTYTATDVAEGLQDFLICIEMFLAALAHAYAFPPRVSALLRCAIGQLLVLVVNLSGVGSCRTAPVPLYQPALQFC